LKEAVDNGLFVTGPVHWHYIGFMGDEQQPFTLEIAIPIAEVPAGYDGKFHTKRTENFKCVSLLHEGGWLEIPNSYTKIMKFVEDNQLQPKAVNREIYINTDFNNAVANVTEIQLGINH
jgi:effector-binding domain-containing protein